MNPKFTLSKMTEEDAREVLAWEYPPPYDFYNADPHVTEERVATLVEPTNLYLSVRDGDGSIVAYYCFGHQAQVDGGDYADDALDVAGQARPDLIGTGFGEMFVRVATDFGKIFFNPPTFRATIPAHNARAVRMCEKSGFEPLSRFVRPNDDVEFIIMRKIVESETEE